MTTKNANVPLELCLPLVHKPSNVNENFIFSAHTTEIYNWDIFISVAQTHEYTKWRVVTSSSDKTEHTTHIQTIHLSIDK